MKKPMQSIKVPAGAFGPVKDPADVSSSLQIDRGDDVLKRRHCFL
jgi:hypothetical protein